MDCTQLCKAAEPHEGTAKGQVPGLVFLESCNCLQDKEKAAHLAMQGVKMFLENTSTFSFLQNGYMHTLGYDLRIVF